MKSSFWILAFVPFLLASAAAAAKPAPEAARDQASGSATPSRPSPETNPKSPDASKALIIHKPMPSPSWGKVISYHREQIMALSDKNRETLHEFLFQDDAGVIRTAIFHEDTSGDGYWEVWVWDQP